MMVWFQNGSASLWKLNSSVILSCVWRSPAGPFLYSISDVCEASRGILQGPKSFISSSKNKKTFNQKSIHCSRWDFRSIWSRCVQSAEASTRRGQRSPSASRREIKKRNHPFSVSVDDSFLQAEVRSPSLQRGPLRRASNTLKDSLSRVKIWSQRGGGGFFLPHCREEGDDSGVQSEGKDPRQGREATVDRSQDHNVERN